MKNTNHIHINSCVHDDKELASTMLNQGNRLCVMLKNIKKVYAKFKLGPFDNQVYHAIRTGNFANIERRLISEAEAKFDSLNLPSPTMRNEVLSGAYALIEELKTAAELFRSKTGTGYGLPEFPLDLITINAEGETEITVENEEKLKERYCRIYLRTPEEVTLYKLAEEAATACNNLLAELKANKASRLPHHMQTPQAIAVLTHALTANGEEVAVNPNWITGIVKYYQANTVAA